MDSKVDEYIATKATDWQKPVLETLRQCMLDCGLQEGIKWGAPTYMHHGNVAAMAAFKHHCALWFFEGALLEDTANVLLNAQEGKTQALRQWRFEKGDMVDVPLVKAYVREAAHNMEQGVRTPKRKVDVVIPELLQAALDAEPQVKRSFFSLAPSHQREYATYIAEAKQEATRLRRLEKSMELLRQGKGLHDRYKNC